MTTKTLDPCPCGAPAPYAACCGRYHAGAPAPDAAALMRSRYSAFVRRDADYLRVTWHAATCPAELGLDADPVPTWLGLKVLRHTPQDATHAEVEFVARYKIGGRAHRLHEISRFEVVDTRWVYVDGEIQPRNRS